jgi:pyridoxamine 5'-phosphate oxidase
MNEQQSENSVAMDISGLRQEYKFAPLKREDMPADPFQQFQTWFQQACDADILEPNAASLATVDAKNRPVLRTVLLKYFDERGFVFFTNLSSAKAAHIAGNANVALMFLWSKYGHQVVIRGTAKKLPAKEVMRYFLTRPRGSQIGAWVSVQSHVISSKSLLAAKFEEMKQKFANHEVPLPSFWGGYRVMPVEMEFWQGQPDRLHDRFLYTRGSEGDWAIERLQP